MTALTDKLRSAPQGSRELSDEFLIAMGWLRRPMDWQMRFLWLDPAGKLYEKSIPSPTESIDDALRFVPEGVTISLLWRNGGNYSAARTFRWGPFGKNTDIGFSERPDDEIAMALCLAVLSAHAQTEKT